MNSCNQPRRNGNTPCNGIGKPMPEMPCSGARKPMPEMPCSGARKPMPEMPCDSARRPMHGMHGCSDHPVGMCYVPMQKWQDIYKPEEGFHYGTIFKELNLMFTGRRVC